MKNKGIKKTFGILIAITLAAGMMTGCGEKKIEKMEQKTSVHEQKKTVKNLKEDDLKNIITGLKDHYILQNAKNIDYLHGLNYDNKIIKKVTSESKDVKLDQVGTYIINYKITVNMTAYEKYQASQKEDKTNKIEQDSKKLQTINVKKKIDVVDEKKAQELADNGTVVWKDNNDTVAKSDGTEVTEEIKEPDSVEDSKDKKMKEINLHLIKSLIIEKKMTRDRQQKQMELQIIHSQHQNRVSQIPGIHHLSQHRSQVSQILVTQGIQRPNLQNLFIRILG